MRTYAVHSLFATLQGEGANAGRRAVFCRFAGCNGWSGLEADRDKGPLGCSAWCDTVFVGMGENGGKYGAVPLAQKIADLWDSPHRPRFVVLTGGEPMLQVDAHLIDVLHRWECEVAVETNGTRLVMPSLDWITVSPKAGAPLVQKIGQELKLVHPQVGAEPEKYAGLPFRHFFLQAMDGPEIEANTRAAVAYCLAHPQWRLSLQAHKILGLK